MENTANFLVRRCRKFKPIFTEVMPNFEPARSMQMEISCVVCASLWLEKRRRDGTCTSCFIALPAIICKQGFAYTYYNYTAHICPHREEYIPLIFRVRSVQTQIATMDKVSMITKKKAPPRATMTKVSESNSTKNPLPPIGKME